jgi:hypothetical protein
MQRYCCDTETATGRKVKIRPWLNGWGSGGPDSAAYMSFQEEMTYRWSVICQGCYCCYSTLDNESGRAEVAGKLFNLAGASRFDRATTVSEAQYRKFRRREAEKLGLTLDDEG